MSYMVKKDEGGQKGASPSRGRIMQVVEVEEDDTSKQKVDIQAPAEIVKEKESSSAVPSGTIGDKEEKPDIASSFPMQSKDTAEKTITDNHEETPPLKTEEKRDIVSELFETKETKVQYPNISIDRKPSKFGFVIWVLVLLGIVGLIGGGLLYVKNRSVSSEPVTAVETPTPTLEPTQTESPIASVSGTPKATPTKIASPSATPIKTGLSIRILNGNEQKGAASAAKKILEEKGYNVVSTGNADNFDYAQTEIIIKSDKISALDKLKTDLSGSYTIGSTSATLDPKAAYDAQVIIGKE